MNTKEYQTGSNLTRAPYSWIYRLITLDGLHCDIEEYPHIEIGPPNIYRRAYTRDFPSFTTDNAEAPIPIMTRDYAIYSMDSLHRLVTYREIAQSSTPKTMVKETSIYDPTTGMVNRRLDAEL